MIKVRDDGPLSGRWVNYARWWWEQNRGPIPAGKRVAHLDGDSLNDDPANLAIMSLGDVVFLWHDRNPEGSARNYAKLRKATAAFNRLSATIRRDREWLPSMWYPVDLVRQRVINRPRRLRWQVYADLGMNVDGSCCRSDRSHALGWPDVLLLDACILSVLASASPGSLRRSELDAAVRSLRNLHDFPEISYGAFSSGISRLRVSGMIRGPRGLFYISPAALASRVAPIQLIPIRGSVIQELYAGFERVSDFRIQDQSHDCRTTQGILSRGHVACDRVAGGDSQGEDPREVGIDGLCAAVG